MIISALEFIPDSNKNGISFREVMASVRACEKSKRRKIHLRLSDTASKRAFKRILHSASEQLLRHKFSVHILQGLQSKDI